MTGRTGGGLSAAEQVQEWDDGPLRAICQLPVFGEGPAPHSPVELGQWEAFLLSLRGGAGTFVMGDPRRAALLGAGPAAGEFPTVDGDHAASVKTLNTRGWGASRSGVLKRGDALQVTKNYITFPRALDNAAWVKNECTVGADTQDNPDPGTQNDAERVTPSGGATDAWVRSAEFAIPAAMVGRVLTASCWRKAAAGSPAVRLEVLNQADVVRDFASGGLSTAWLRQTLSNTFFQAGDTGGRLRVGGSSSWIEAEGAVDAWGAAVYSAELDARLHYVLEDVDSDAAGKASFAIYPRLRAAAADFSPLLLSNAVGTWRLAKASIERAMDRRKLCSIGFEAVEAINLS